MDEPSAEQVALKEKQNRGGFKKTTEQITHELKLEAMLNKHRQVTQTATGNGQHPIGINGHEERIS